MATLTVGPTSTYPTIAAALQAAAAGDTLLLQSGYSNETATVSLNGITVSGDASSTGIVVQIGAGVATFTLAGTAPINVLDAPDGEGIVGNGGNNVITVSGGADAVDGGQGTDRLIVDYRLATGAVTGNSTSNFAEAGGGARLVTITNGTVEHFTVLTGAGADTITTGAGDDIINTGEGAGTVTAGQGFNQITGGSGADTITGGDGGNIVTGGNGTNTVTTGDGADTITGGTGVDTIVAGGGNDLITVNGGADTSSSGAGNDRLVVNYAALTTAVSGGVTGGTLAGGYTGSVSDQGTNSIGFDGTENFTVTTGSGNDTITTGDGLDVLSGGAGNDLLNAGGGADTVNGGTGDDVLRGRGGNDVLNGGAGIDTADYSLAAAGVDVRLNGGGGRNDGDGGVDTLTEIENATGSAFDDVVIGGDAANVLTGGAGRDVLVGLAGDDTLSGGAGAGNEMIGGAGDDTYVVAASDTLVEAAGEGTDTVQTSLTYYQLRSDFENLTYSGTGAFVGVGNGAANAVTGGTGRDVLIGLGGNDTISGGTGAANEVYGGLGDDRYIVQAAGDTIIENAGEGTDTVETSVASHTLKANLENLTYTGSGTFAGTGNAQANVITGGAGTDTLTGAGGDDTLNGGDGQDTAQLSGAQGDYTIVALGGGGYRVTDNVGGRDGVDTLSGVEQLRFANGSALALGATPSPDLSDKDAGDAFVLPGLTGDDFVATGDGMDFAERPSDFDGFAATFPAERTSDFMLTLGDNGQMYPVADGPDRAGGLWDNDGWML